MLSALARSALRASAPVQVASRTTFTLPIVSNRAYSAISEALEHPDASSTATTTKRTRSSPTKTAAKKPVSDKAKEKAALAKEKAALAKQKQKEKKEKEKAQALKDKAKAKELKAKAAAKLKADKLKEKEKAKAEKEKAAGAPDKPLMEAVEDLLAVPTPLAHSPLAIFLGGRMKEEDKPSFKAVHEEWKEATQATKDKFARLAAENKNANDAALASFIESHKPIEIYKHNRAVRRIQGLRKEGVTSNKIGRTLAPRGLQLKMVEDPRVPTSKPPTAMNLYMSENLQGSVLENGEVQSRFTARVEEWKALSESEKEEWKEKAEKQRKEVWEPAMMEVYGTTQPGHIKD